MVQAFQAGYGVGERMRERDRKNKLAEIFGQSYTPATTQTYEAPDIEGNATDTYTKQVPGAFDPGKFAMLANQQGFGPEAYQMNKEREAAAVNNAMRQLMLADKLGHAPTTRKIQQGDEEISQEWNPNTRSWSEVGRGRKVYEWQMPGYVDTQRKIAEAKGEGKMSPTTQKELFEADEVTQSATNVIDILNRAKQINKTAYYGPLAVERAKAMSLLPGDRTAENATVDLDNMMTGQALESLKAIFGGMPTEGERKILLDIQASASKTPAQREAIINRAIEMAQRRLGFNKSKADAIRKGTYFKEAPEIKSTAQQPSIDDLLKKY